MSLALPVRPLRDPMCCDPSSEVAVEGGKARVCLGYDGVVHVSYREGSVIDDSDARAIMSAVNAACKDRRRPLLVDLGGLESVSRRARQIFAIRSRVSVIAFFGSSPVDSVIAKFFMRLHPMPCPAAFFVDRPAAVQWLRTIERRRHCSKAGEAGQQPAES